MMSIPKKIHRMWWQGERELPAKFKGMLKSCARVNPGYTQIVWDEKSIMKLVATKYPKLVDLFENKYSLLHQKIDAAKYVILDHVGGVYIDMDVTCLKPLDTVLRGVAGKTAVVSMGKLSGVIASWMTSKMYNNGIICSAPKSAFSKALVASLVDAEKDNAWLKNVWGTLYLFRTTGPVFFSSVAARVMDTIHVADPGTFEPCEPYDSQDECDVGDSVTVHHYTKTWNVDSTRSIQRPFYKHLDEIAVAMTVVLVGGVTWLVYKHH